MATVRWGIMGAGSISKKMVGDLLIDPSTRNVSDIVHTVAAVASRNVTKAQEFIDECFNGFEAKKPLCKALGTYEDLVADPDVDIVYIGTPHSHHYANAKLCLEGGKSVLCEKPLTVNADQARSLSALATSKGLFFMEALWTRFFPLAHAFQACIAKGDIGQVQQIEADLSINMGVDARDPGHRLVDPNLAAGALLDLGPYPWTWIAMAGIHPAIRAKGSAFESSQTDGGEQPAKKSKLSQDTPLSLPVIKASQIPYVHPKAANKTPIDAATIAVLALPTPSGGTCQAIFKSSMRHHVDPQHAVLVTGTRGRIRVPFPTYRPERFFLTSYPSEDAFAAEKDAICVDKEFNFPFPGDAWGFIWEADEAARCVVAKKVECDRMPHRETILMMEAFDEMRRQGGTKLPASIESTV